MGPIYFFSLNTSLLVGAPSDSSKGELPISLKNVNCSDKYKTKNVGKDWGNAKIKWNAY